MKPSAPPRRSNFKGGGLQRSLRPESAWLNVPAGSSTVPVRWKWHYARLTQFLQTLRGDQREHLQDAADIKPALRRRAAESATEEFDRDMLLSEASSEQDFIYEVNEALRRIELGTYGICEITGKGIAPARLRAVPWTRFSQQAARSLELNGAVHGTRFGQLRSARPSADTREGAASFGPKKTERKANSKQEG
jgi:RNA polymerase-binding transcription factor DksA